MWWIGPLVTIVLIGGVFLFFGIKKYREEKKKENFINNMIFFDNLFEKQDFLNKLKAYYSNFGYFPQNEKLEEIYVKYSKLHDEETQYSFIMSQIPKQQHSISDFIKNASDQFEKFFVKEKVPTSLKEDAYKYITDFLYDIHSDAQITEVYNALYELTPGKYQNDFRFDYALMIRLLLLSFCDQIAEEKTDKTKEANLLKQAILTRAVKEGYFISESINHFMGEKHGKL